MTGALVRGFSPRWTEKLAGVLPPDLARNVMALAEIHAGETDRPKLSDRETREALETLERQIGRFREAVRDLPSEVSDAVHIAAFRMGDMGLIGRCDLDLAAMDRAVGIAWQSVNPKIGAGGSGQEAFAREVARAFIDHQLKPESKPRGDYCFALHTAFEAIKDERGVDLMPADLAGLARRALGRLRKKGG